MSANDYAQQAWAIADNIRLSLSSADAAALRDELRREGEAAWLLWAEQNRIAVFSLLSRSAAQRAKWKPWADPSSRPRLVLAAYRQARLGALILDAAAQLQPGGSYRSTLELAAWRASELEKEFVQPWPFDDDAPFPHWRVVH